MLGIFGDLNDLTLKTSLTGTPLLLQFAIKFKNL